MPASVRFLPVTICILHRDTYNRTCYILTLKNFWRPSSRSLRLLTARLQFNEYLCPFPTPVRSRHVSPPCRFLPLSACSNNIPRNLTRVRLPLPSYSSFFFFTPDFLSFSRPGIAAPGRSSIPPDFDWPRRTSFVEIAKVSRDTMNYSCRGDAKLRETFLRLGGLPLCVRTRPRAFVHACRWWWWSVSVSTAYPSTRADGFVEDEGARRARSRNECGKAWDHRAWGKGWKFARRRIRVKWEGAMPQDEFIMC